MRLIRNLALAGAMAVTSVSYAPIASAQETHLSQCMRNGLVGAGVGGVIGAITSHHHRLRNAAIGAAVGGVGTWAVCRMLTQHDQEHVESAYQQSLSDNHAYNDSWSSDNGDTRTVHVSDPAAAPNAGPDCKSVSATISDPQNGSQDLPPEVFCRNSEGQWVPQE